MYWSYVYIHSFLFPIAQAKEFGTLTRVSSNELIDQLFAHIMSEKKQDGYGVDDLFSTKARKASTANETHKLSVSIRANRSTVCTYHKIFYLFCLIQL